jgi:hypothetical protein
MPSGLTISGVASRVMPMKATLMPSNFSMPYGAKMVFPLSLYFTFAARNGKLAPR